MKDKIEDFNKKAVTIFKILIDSYSYKLQEIKTFYYNDIKWSTRHIYVNEKLNLKIEIEQVPYYTDYGFSFTIYKDNDKYQLCYNIPHEQQDENYAFLSKAYSDIFSNNDTLDLISGKK